MHRWVSEVIISRACDFWREAWGGILLEIARLAVFCFPHTQTLQVKHKGMSNPGLQTST